MSLLYTPNFKYPEGDMRKAQEFVDSSPLFHPENHHQLNNSVLTRYRSAPCSSLESLVNVNSTGGDGCEDYPYFRPEIDTPLAKYMPPCNSSGDSASQGFQEFGVKSMKQEHPELLTEQNEYSNGHSQVTYQNLHVRSVADDNSVNVGDAMDNSFSVASSTAMAVENSLQERKTTRNGSNLIRQNSSPAGLFSNLGVDSGFGGMRDEGYFRACGSTNGGASTSASRRLNRFNFCPGSSSRFMPQIAEFGSQSTANSTVDKTFASNNDTSQQYVPNFPSDSLDNISFSGIKRARDYDCNMSFGLNEYETQNESYGNQSTRLVHHLSLPKTSAEMAVVEKFLHFQGSVPCKIRAKRGFATHPRSIAERVRRTRISERMRKLQDLFPNMDKQTNTAEMLDLAVDYIKDLQKEVKTLEDIKAKCICSRKQEQH